MYKDYVCFVSLHFFSYHLFPFPYLQMAAAFDKTKCAYTSHKEGVQLEDPISLELIDTGERYSLELSRAPASSEQKLRSPIRELIEARPQIASQITVSIVQSYSFTNLYKHVCACKDQRKIPTNPVTNLPMTSQEVERVEEMWRCDHTIFFARVLLKNNEAAFKRCLDQIWNKWLSSRALDTKETRIIKRLLAPRSLSIFTTADCKTCEDKLRRGRVQALALRPSSLACVNFALEDGKLAPFQENFALTIAHFAGPVDTTLLFRHVLLIHEFNKSWRWYSTCSTDGQDKLVPLTMECPTFFEAVVADQDVTKLFRTMRPQFA